MMQNLGMLAIMAKYKIRQLLTDEKGEVNIVAIVVLIGIAVLLAVVFKEKIIKLLDSLFTAIDQSATDAIGGGAGGTGAGAGGAGG